MERAVHSQVVQCFLVVPTGRVIPEKPILDAAGKVIGTSIDFMEYKRLDTGEAVFQYPWQFGPGAMWFTKYDYLERPCSFLWDNEHPEGHLYVVCPNGRHWDIDSRCSNCTLPQDRTHRCWVRHGEPPVVTVDKSGVTCRAGAGSIQAGDYHGFLRNGQFVSC